MNSLEEILDGIERRVNIIHSAVTLGFQNFYYKGDTYFIIKGNKAIEIHGTTLKLVLDLNWINLKNIARNFGLFWTASEEAKKVLEKEIEKLERDKKNLSVFLLQEKVTSGE